MVCMAFAFCIFLEKFFGFEKMKLILLEQMWVESWTKGFLLSAVQHTHACCWDLFCVLWSLI